jgi:tetrapyrrole methylase family protein / MazG family protein
MPITVIGLGPAGPNELTTGTLEAIAAHEHRFLRTNRHPSASVLSAATSFDDLYETLDSFDEVYAAIVEALVAADRQYQRVLYAVPGSPLVAEQSVQRLLADPRVRVDIVPALSFLDLTWARLRIDPQQGGVRLIDGMNFAAEIEGERGPVLVSQCHSKLVLSEVKCSLLDPPSTVTVLQRLGLPDENIVSIAWDDLDRVVEPDHLTSLWIPTLRPPLRFEMKRLVDVMDSLRTQCPWDQEQTHMSLAPFAIEEAYELAEAIAADADPNATDADTDHLVEELGDLLFQVIFHSHLGQEDGRFSLADVACGLSDKLIRRHPHVFGDAQVDSAHEVRVQWENTKRTERVGDGQEHDPMAGLTEGLPALLYASKVLKRAEATSYVNIPTGNSQSADDLRTNEHGSEEWIAADAENEIGRRLLALVGESRQAKIDPERALRLAAARLRDDVRAATTNK